MNNTLLSSVLPEDKRLGGPVTPHVCSGTPNWVGSPWWGHVGGLWQVMLSGVSTSEARLYCLGTVCLCLAPRSSHPVPELLHRAQPRLHRNPEWPLRNQPHDGQIQREWASQRPALHVTWNHRLFPQRPLPEPARIQAGVSGWGQKGSIHPCLLTHHHLSSQPPT